MEAISVFSPSIDERRWVSQGSNTLDSEHIIEIDSIPTIFKVPKPTNETKPEAYTPQLLGLGPYHHLRPEFYNSDRQKLGVVKKLVKQNPLTNLFYKMRKLEPVVRANYDKYLDLEGYTLDYIISVDSLYLLCFLGSYDEKTEAGNLEPGRRELAKDVVMLENQIPAFALVQMGKEIDFFSLARGTFEQNTEAENLEPDYIGYTETVVTSENQIPAVLQAKMEKEQHLISRVEGTFEQNTEAENLEPYSIEYTEELIISENKIPDELVKTMLHPHLYYNFCKAHSPLKVAEQWEIRQSESEHLLAHMYNLIINREIQKKHKMPISLITDISVQGIESLTILRELGLGGAMINPLLFAFKSLQVLAKSKLGEEITKKEEQQKPKILKIEIPSASELSEKHNVVFCPLAYGGIRNVEFTSKNICLPEITLSYARSGDFYPWLYFEPGLKMNTQITAGLRCDSEVVLRNLVAYEAAVKSTFELAEYVDFMCGIVHTSKDVALLREMGIVKGDLNDEQVAKIFNGISKSVAKSKEETASQKVVKELKETVEKWERENQKWYNRQHKFLLDIAKNTGEFLRKPFGIAMKYLMFMFMVLLLVLQILQVYCQVYGCNIGGSKAKTISLIMSA